MKRLMQIIFIILIVLIYSTYQVEGKGKPAQPQQKDRPEVTVGDEITPTLMVWPGILSDAAPSRTFTIYPAAGHAYATLEATNSSSLVLVAYHLSDDDYIVDAKMGPTFAPLTINFPVENDEFYQITIMDQQVMNGKAGKGIKQPVEFEFVVEYPTPVIAPDPGTPKTLNTFSGKWTKPPRGYHYPKNVSFYVDVGAEGTLDADLTSTTLLNPTIYVYDSHNNIVGGGPGSSGFAFVKGAPVRPGTFKITAIALYPDTFELRVWAP